MMDQQSGSNSGYSGQTPSPAPGQTPPPPPPPAMGYMYPPPPPAQSSTSRNIANRVATYLISTILIVSLLANVYFAIIIFGQMNATRSSVTETDYREPADKLAKDRIVIIPVEGIIDEMTFYFVNDALTELAKEPPRAVVLRVNSGGGGVGSCDRITDAITRFRTKTENKIPIVASYGTVSASGGYYISANADHIMAEPICTTGSIGVIAAAMTFEGTLEKLGITPETIVASDSPKKAVANDVFRAWNEQDREKLQEILDFAHEQFKRVVTNGFDHRFKDRPEERPSDEQILALTNGDIFTTTQALENKLVDSEGYLDDAIAEAERRAGLKVGETRVTTIHPRPALMDVLLGANYQQPAQSGLNPTNIQSDKLQKMMTDLVTPKLEYRFNLLQP